MQNSNRLKTRLFDSDESESTEIIQRRNTRNTKAFQTALSAASKDTDKMEMLLRNITTAAASDIVASVQKLLEKPERDSDSIRQSPTDIQNIIAKVSGAGLSEKESDRLNAMSASFYAILEQDVQDRGPSLFDEMNQAILTQILDRRYVSQMIPEIGRAFDIYLSAILNPNGVQDQSILPIQISSDSGATTETRNEFRQAFVRILKEQYGIGSEMVQRIVYNALRDGVYYVGCIPYKQALGNVLFKSSVLAKRYKLSGVLKSGTMASGILSKYVDENGVSAKMFSDISSFSDSGDDSVREFQDMDDMVDYFRKHNDSTPIQFDIDAMTPDVSEMFTGSEDDMSQFLDFSKDETRRSFRDAMSEAIEKDTGMMPFFDGVVAVEYENTMKLSGNKISGFSDEDSQQYTDGLTQFLNSENGMKIRKKKVSEIVQILEEKASKIRFDRKPLATFVKSKRKKSVGDMATRNLEGSMFSIKPSEPEYDSSRKVEELLEKDLTGCVVREFLRENVIPMEINNTCCGYLVLDRKGQQHNSYYDTETMNSILPEENLSQDHMDRRVCDILKRDDGLVATIHKLFGHVVATKMDIAKFSESPAYKTFIYEILNFYGASDYNRGSRSSDAFGGRVDVSFFPKKWITEFGTRKSLISGVMFFAKWYLLTIAKTLMTHIQRGDSARAFYVQMDEDAENGSQFKMNETARDFAQHQANRNLKFGKLSGLSMPTLFNAVTSSRDMYIPTIGQGEGPIKMELSELMQSLDSEVPELLINAIAMKFKIPVSGLTEHENPPTATEIMVANDQFRQTVGMLQIPFSDQFTQMIRTIWDLHYRSESYEFLYMRKTDGRKHLVITPKLDKEEKSSDPLKDGDGKKSGTSQVMESKFPASALSVVFSPGVLQVLSGRDELMRAVVSTAENLFQALDENEQKHARMLYLAKHLKDVMSFTEIADIIAQATEASRKEKLMAGDSGGGGGSSW